MGTLIGIYAVGLASHIFLDVLTSFGTMVWSPLNYARPAWDWLFIIDLTADVAGSCAAACRVGLSPAGRRLAPRRGTLGGASRPRPSRSRRWCACLACHFPRPPRSARHWRSPAFFLLPLRRGSGIRTGRAKWCRIGVALVTSYLIFAAGMHHTALERVTEFANEQGLPYQSIAALPLPPSAADWAGLITTSEGVYRVEFSQFGGDPVKIQYFSQPPASRLPSRRAPSPGCAEVSVVRTLSCRACSRARRPNRRPDHRFALLWQSPAGRSAGRQTPLSTADSRLRLSSARTAACSPITGICRIDLARAIKKRNSVGENSYLASLSRRRGTGRRGARRPGLRCWCGRRTDP